MREVVDYSLQRALRNKDYEKLCRIAERAIWEEYNSGEEKFDRFYSNREYKLWYDDKDGEFKMSMYVGNEDCHKEIRSYTKNDAVIANLDFTDVLFGSAKEYEKIMPLYQRLAYNATSKECNFRYFLKDYFEKPLERMVWGPLAHLSDNDYAVFHSACAGAKWKKKEGIRYGNVLFYIGTVEYIGKHFSICVQKNEQNEFANDIEICGRYNEDKGDFFDASVRHMKLTNVDATDIEAHNRAIELMVKM